jgi:hypothetical protein
MGCYHIQPFKSGGTDGIVSAIMQQEVDLLTLMYFWSLPVKGYIAKARRQVKVTFVPKPRKAICTKAKEFHPINLSSFMLKMMAKFVDRCIRD